MLEARNFPDLAFNDSLFQVPHRLDYLLHLASMNKIFDCV